ncbi:MAG: hypothetical protein KAT68_02800 [Bacteroidales bacterium]|nr:hypothetical protein [Bacteroidales bacterium]
MSKNIQNYINQLITDLQEAAKRIPPKPYYEHGPELDGIEYVLEWENNPYQKMSKLFGIEKFNFPSSEKLNDKQLEILTDEIEKLWLAYNFYPDFPDNLPAKYKYKVMVDFWDEEVQYISEGQSHIEFCHYEPKNVRFPKNIAGVKIWLRNGKWIMKTSEKALKTILMSYLFEYLTIK